MGVEWIQRKDIVTDCIKTWGGQLTMSECLCGERWGREGVEGAPGPPWDSVFTVVTASLWQSPLP